ncbi:MAG TPA: hypothetical protein VNQ79_17605 [Blastocatellia bacterium]|nr:hypothetical protein [Blastocatellia bacterium]
MSQAAYTPPPVIDRIQSRALIAGGIGLIACVIGAFFKPAQFFNSWLISFMFVIGITLGCLALVMLQYLTGGAWGLVIRRVLESATRTLPLIVLLFIPLLFGLQKLYAWARPAEVAAHEALQHKRLYLNVPFFLVRGVIYFAAWLLLAYFLNKWSRQQDQANDARLERRFQLLSGGGLVLYVLTVTFAVIDWVMSLEPEWFSTIFGLLFVAGQGLSAMAFVIAALVVLSRYEPLAHVISRGHLHDLGKLMLTFVMLWAYLSFSQFLIIWSGNLPEETVWYVERLRGGWQWIGLLLVLFHFALPFLLLLSSDLKRSGRLMIPVALLVMAMRAVDLFWIIAPALNREHLAVHWMDIAALVGLSGLWLAFFAWQLRRRPLLPVNDPHFGEVLQHEHH